MKIEVSLVLNGKTVTPSEDLQNSLIEIVESYIKHKIFGDTTKVKKVKVPKDPNAPKGTPRKKTTPEEVANIIQKAYPLQHLVLDKAITVLKQETGRSWGTIYKFLRPEIAKGNLKFVPADYKRV